MAGWRLFDGQIILSLNIVYCPFLVLEVKHISGQIAHSCHILEQVAVTETQSSQCGQKPDTCADIRQENIQYYCNNLGNSIEEINRQVRRGRQEMMYTSLWLIPLHPIKTVSLFYMLWVENYLLHASQFLLSPS